LMRPGGSGFSLLSTSPMAFTQTGSRANLQFNPTIDGALMGTHTFNMEITMHRFPEMNNFTRITRSFVLTITSACTTNEIIPPNPDFPKNLQYVIEKSLLVRENAEISDTGSKTAIDRGYTWPTNAFFCGPRTYNFVVAKFKHVYMGWTTDEWAQPILAVLQREEPFTDQITLDKMQAKANWL